MRLFCLVRLHFLRLSLTFGQNKRRNNCFEKKKQKKRADEGEKKDKTRFFITSSVGSTNTTMLHSMPRGIFFVLLSSALQALNRPVVEIEVHVAPRYSC